MYINIFQLSNQKMQVCVCTHICVCACMRTCVPSLITTKSLLEHLGKNGLEQQY